MRERRTIKTFGPDELLFDEEETRIILKFIFKPVHHKTIDELPMTDRLRSFAQGLLVEAIDASYAIGIVDAIRNATKNPLKGPIAILKKFTIRNVKKLFDKVQPNDLRDIKIYQFVLDQLGGSFVNDLSDFRAGIDPEPGSYMADRTIPKSQRLYWG